MAPPNVGPQPRLTTQGPAYGYTEPVPQRRVITDLITNVSKDEFPLMMYFGISAEGRGGGNKASAWNLENWPGRVVQWFEDDYYQRASTVSGGVDNAVTTIPVGDAYVFRQGDVIWCENEAMLVTNVDHTAGPPATVTVTRGFFGTTAATHADTTAIMKRTQIQVEGADVHPDIHDYPLQKWNACQIIERECKVSLRSEQVSTYGSETMMGLEVQKKFKECLQDLNGAVYYNPNLATGAAPAASPRSWLGGFPHFLNQAAGSGYHDASGGDLTVYMVEDVIQGIWQSVKRLPTLMVCGGTAARMITSAFDQKVRMTQDETTGGAVIQTIRTHFTDLDILMDPWCPPDTAYLLTPDLVGILPATEFFLKDLSEDGFYTRQGIYGDYTLVVMHAKAHGVIENIATTFTPPA